MPKDIADAHEPAAFLGVEASASGRRWIGPAAATDRMAEALVQTAGLHPAVAGILARRGIDADSAPGHLAPLLRDMLPDPMRLRDMGQAADRLIAAVARGERIAVFADYDVDGAASAALLVTWLRDMGRDATIYVPDRIDEGYGPNAAAMAQLAATHDLIFCVDCGTLGHGPIAAARGADVIVLDHHMAGETLPDCLAVVNPNRLDEDRSLSHLCAAAVVFLLLVEANRRLRGAHELPDLMAALDLVALATVADVAPLVGLNRALVRQGLAVMARRARPGLVALADVARMDAAPTPYHLGFLLGPRINAGGRVGQADLGARLLTAGPAEAATIAARLDSLNDERRAVEAAVRDAALDSATVDGPLAWAAGEGWHPGVVGIVAARLAEATGRPSVVVGLSGAFATGSGRSVAGFDLGAAVHRLVAEGLLVKGGGHPMAAGLTVARDSLAPAMARLRALLAQQGAIPPGPKVLRLDGLLMPSAVTPEVIAQIDAAGPFGMGAPAPRFALPDCRVHHVRRVGERHLKASVGDGAARLDVIGFGLADTPLGDAVERHGGGRLHLAGRVELNLNGGRARPQLRLEDASRV